MITAADLQGHWVRDWIKAPGFEDQTTQVHWLQAGALFADIRVPADRPDLGGAQCLADLSAEALWALLAAEGFAGTISVAESRCTWQREINWHGIPEADDIGAMWVAEDGALMEDGVLAEYQELWRAAEAAPLRGHRISLGDQTGILIENDEAFLAALGPMPRGTSEAMRAALAEGHADPKALRRHFASLYVLGRWDGDQGVATLATNPFCEGKPVIQRQPWTWHAPDFDGSTVAQPMRVIAPGAT